MALAQWSSINQNVSSLIVSPCCLHVKVSLGKILKLKLPVCESLCEALLLLMSRWHLASATSI